jgi:hypothetical protein|tara:strand:+ start:35333 stop:35659 length:327 start_codon:yes stop_codon:yes gene_type:complete
VKNNLKSQEDEFLICTEQFVTITIQIMGDAPTNYYTLRPKTSDTLKIESYFENYYPIVNDNLVSSLERDSTEQLIFVGERTANPIREVFEIKSDGCHVTKVSGVDSVY